MSHFFNYLACFKRKLLHLVHLEKRFSDCEHMNICFPVTDKSDKDGLFHVLNISLAKLYVCSKLLNYDEACINSKFCY